MPTTTIVLRDEQGREFAYDESARKFVGRQSGGVQTLEAINKIAAGIVFCGRGWERQYGETSAAVAAGRLGLVVEYQGEELFGDTSPDYNETYHEYSSDSE